MPSIRGPSLWSGNYSNVSSLNWVDDQPTPTVQTNITMSFPYTTPNVRLWVASPDFDQGRPQTIPFTQNNGTVQFVLPQIKYWSMIVAETAARVH
jgi:dextranase